ncbi:DNA-binding protein [Schizophyllum fasciatum]
MKLSFSALVLLLVVPALAGPLEAREGEVSEDREHCGLKDARGKKGQCGGSVAQQCWSSGAQCDYDGSSCTNGAETVKGICEFYLFVRRKKYDTPVFQSRHPGLNEYISGAVKAVGEELVQGTVSKVVVVIKDKDNEPLERFIFALESMIEVEAFNKDTSVENAMRPAALSQYFRSFLVKLNMIEAQLGQMYLGDDVSFAIVLELKDDRAPSAAIEKGDPPPWLPADGQHTTAGASDDAQLHIVRAVNTGIINVSGRCLQSTLVVSPEGRPPSSPAAKRCHITAT